MGTSNWPKPGTINRPPTGTFPWPLTQPGLLVAGHVRQAQPHRCSPRWLQGHDHAHSTPARIIEGETEVGPADRLAFPLVHDDQVDDRVVDLYPLQDRVDTGDVVASGLQRTGGIRSSPAARDLRRMQAGNSCRHRVPRRRGQSPRHAGLPDLAVDHRDAALLPRQEPFADRLGDDCLHPVVQPTRPPAAVGACRHEVSRAARACTKPFQQHVNLAAGNSQFGGCLVDRCHPGATPAPASIVRTLGQAPDDLSLPQHSIPTRGMQRQVRTRLNGNHLVAHS